MESEDVSELYSFGELLDAVLPEYVQLPSLQAVGMGNLPQGALSL